jgi:uncharacterized delta-60 repeat protein
VDAAGNIYLAGPSTSGATTQVGVAKVTAAGDLDPAFGTGGVFFTTVGGQNSDEGDAVSVQPNGRVVVSGTAQVSVTDFDFFALQLTPAGKLDPAFNPTGPTPGINRFDFGANAADFVGSATINPDGRILIAGSNTTTGGAEVARLIGTVGQARALAVGGSLDGKGRLFTPDAAGKYTAAATVAGLGSSGANARVAVGDVNGDGAEDTILVTGPGTAIRLAVVSGTDNSTMLVSPFDPFGGNFTGGGFVAAADLNNDGRAEVIVTLDQGGGPRVVIFSLGTDGTFTPKASFFGIDDPGFRGGARAGVGDVNGDGVADLAVAAGFQGGPRVAVFDGKTVAGTPTRLVNDFFAFDPVLRNGTYVAIGDVDGDGFGDLVFGAGPGGAPRLLTVSGKALLTSGSTAAIASPLSNFFVAGNASDRGGVRPAVADADGDNRADVVVGSGEGSVSGVRVYLGRNFGGAEPATVQTLDPFGGAVLTDGVFVG